jgi:hypothetical protein
MKRWLSILTATAFALWGAWVLLRYFADFGSLTVLGAGIILIFTNYLYAFSICLAAIGLLLLAVHKSQSRARPNTTSPGLSLRAKYLIFLAMAVLPFVVWPALQLLYGASVAEVAPGLGAAAATMLLAFAAFATGLRLARWLKHDPKSLLEQAVAASALGFGAFMFASFLFGVAHFYYRPVAWLAVAAGLYFGWNDLRRFLAVSRMYLRVHTRTRKRFLAVFLAGGVLLIFAIMLSAGMFLRYPVGYDAMISYLTYPKEYVQAHGMVAFPHWVYWGFPQNAEVLFTLGWLLGGFRVPIGIIYLFTLLTGGAILLFMRGRSGVAKVIALLIFYTLPVVAYQNLLEHKIEIIFAYYILVAYFFLLRYARERQRSLLLVCAICSGLAAGLKYFFFPWYAVPIILFLAWMAWRDRAQIQALWIWGVIAVGLFVPWMAKNVVVSGRPLEPVATPFLQVPRQTFFAQLGPAATDFVVTEMRNETYLLWDDHERKDLAFFLRAPFDLTFMGNKKYVSDGLLLGPILLFFLPLVLTTLARRRPLTVEVKFAALSLPLLAAGWIFLGHLVIWYALPIYALFAVAAGWATEEAVGRRVRLVAILALCAWVAVFLSGQYLRRLTYGPMYYLGGEQRSEIWLTAQWINSHLPPQAKVWGLHEPRGFYVERSFERYIPDNYHLAFSWLLRARGAAGTLQFLKDNHIEYLLIRGGDGLPETPNLAYWTYLPNGSKRYAELIRNNNDDLVAFKNEYLELIYKDGSHFLYRVKEK